MNDWHVQRAVVTNDTLTQRQTHSNARWGEQWAKDSFGFAGLLRPRTRAASMTERLDCTVQASFLKLTVGPTINDQIHKTCEGKLVISFFCMRTEISFLLQETL